jgi:FAD/FMN-containing dehydrogenase
MPPPAPAGTPSSRAITRRRAVAWSLGAGALAALGVVGRAAWHLLGRASRERSLPRDAADGSDVDATLLDDKSGLEETRVATFAPATALSAATLLAETAGTSGPSLSVSIGGARHSMGGQTLHADSLHLARALPATAKAEVAYRDDRSSYVVDAGSTWRQVLDTLAERQRSVAVMQSNNDFTIGGSISVNAHGWQSMSGPVGSSVTSLEIALADGTRLPCSRTENAELFSLACGGFGLFGVITSAELAYVPDRAYALTTKTFDATQYLETWQALVRDNPRAAMSYGRLRISRKRFLEDAVLNVFDDQDAPLTAVAGSAVSPSLAPPVSAAAAGSAALHEELVRAVFRGSEASEYGKRLRWDLEVLTGGEAVGMTNRSTILNTSSQSFANRDPARVDLLHESFVPRAALAGLVADLRRILPKHDVDLLNITIRDVTADRTARLNYAKEDVFALVFLFNLARDREADARLGDCVREVIDATLDRNGSFYLPYRPYATRAQVERAYPELQAFVAAKHRWDPKGRFRSRFAEHYRLV